MWELARVVFLGTMAGVLGTGMGGIVLGLGSRPQGAELSFNLSLSGGVMLAVVFLDLIPEALNLSGLHATLLGLISGTAFLQLLKPALFRRGKGGLIQTGLFLGLGIATHNLPEGLAIGAGYLASEQLGLGLALTLCLHNIPEGMAMAGPLLAGGMGPTAAVLWTLAAGLPMGVGALLGGVFGSLSSQALSFTLSFAAGAMLFLVIVELFPTADFPNHPSAAAWGAVLGVMLGLVLFSTL